MGANENETENAHHSHLHDEDQTRFVSTPPGVLERLLIVQRGAHEAVLDSSAYVVVVGLLRRCASPLRILWHALPRNPSVERREGEGMIQCNTMPCVRRCINGGHVCLCSNGLIITVRNTLGSFIPLMPR